MEIFDTILKSVLGAGTTAGITFLTLWWKNRKELKLCVSRGLATGYYYNFIKDIFEEESITVITKDGTEHIYMTDSITLDIILPSKLTEAAIKLARNYETRDTNEGQIRRGTKRPFPIHFQGDSKKLRIIDMAGPINALALYIDNLPRYKDTDGDTTSRLLKKQSSERENFKKTIISLYRSKGFGEGKISFKDENGNIIA